MTTHALIVVYKVIKANDPTGMHKYAFYFAYLCIPVLVYCASNMMNDAKRPRAAVSKTERQRLIRALLKENQVQSQEQLVQLLAEQAVKVTQTTLSRDLSELQVWKKQDHYVLGDEHDEMHTASPVRAQKTQLEQVLKDLLISAEVAGNLVVLKTNPGRAQPIGWELDNAQLPLVVGNISGDDTIFIATRSEKEANTLSKQFKKIAELD